MITHEQAERIAAEAVGPAGAGDGQGWHLVEFDAGWVVWGNWFGDPSMRGGAVCVVERATGRVMSFPSSVAVTRIMSEYNEVIDRASPVSD
jgi:hypothetical protein